MQVKKTRLTAGADQKTPSKSQYFSWINNTNEGSTQQNTIINLAYFQWLRDTYGMQLDIYAWDAGNLDGANKTYESFESEKLKEQFPNGYAPIARVASEIGTKLGVWCGPDGFGKTKTDAEKRSELMVSLCRDFNFGLFKMDAVCGVLRKSKQKYFVEMMKRCREYQPDLILLNHRLNLGKGMPYATTFLWEGVETYMDVHVTNPCTAFHHRAYMFERNLVPGLDRLAEDHGVCVSSCMDYFEDDLIYQAFCRSLILAPEIYGNPWLLRDGEQARLAHIYNLHRRYSDILVYGKVLPKSYTKNSTSRGDGKTRFITLGNCSWQNKTVSIQLSEKIGLSCDGRVIVKIHHPYEKTVGVFNVGETVDIEVKAFRACLVEVSAVERCDFAVVGCEYEVLHENDRHEDRIKIVSASDKVCVINPSAGETLREIDAVPFDGTQREPLLLSKAFECPLPENSEKYVETAYFTADNDSMEARSLRRAGKTSIPQVQAARDAFFSQSRYALRGCECAFAFDGKADTFFDGLSKYEHGFSHRFDGGCLRVDFGDVYEADEVVIEYFSFSERRYETPEQHVEATLTYSENFDSWKTSEAVKDNTLESNSSLEVVVHKVHNIIDVPGDRKEAIYGVSGKIRYFRLHEPMDRIFKISLRKNEKEIKLASPRANNLFRSYFKRPAQAAQSCTVNISSDKYKEGCFLSVALNGKHGTENAYVVADLDGRLYGCPDRATSYPCNFWECPARNDDSNYTYYLPVTREMLDRDINIYVLVLNAKEFKAHVSVYLCDANNEIVGMEISV